MFKEIFGSPFKKSPEVEPLSQKKLEELAKSGKEKRKPEDKKLEEYVESPEFKESLDEGKKRREEKEKEREEEWSKSDNTDVRAMARSLKK